LGAWINGLGVANLPEMAEVFGNRPGIPDHKDAKENQAMKQGRFDTRENILDQGAKPDASVFKKVRKMIMSTATSCWRQLTANFEKARLRHDPASDGELRRKQNARVILQNRPPRRDRAV